ncbi:hypothetical protein BDW02DRAFT_579650 [Decorospora gaudefroyi]|uniref:Uncharacterized protein n=1 Tax=Decorospora gaudefroyi TaxID=184978 RepID=A0A6A5KIR5_9PLEO|nr:hypothetical protein BDW02DRAFT_579650 [Decorospora gaudefroyi]
MITTFLTLFFPFLALASQYNISSAPFHLVLQCSEDPTLNGKPLAACHTGVTIESLCVPQPGSGRYEPAAVLYHNTSIQVEANVTTPHQYPQLDDAMQWGTRGILTWLMPFQPHPIPSAMTLLPETLVDIAIPIIRMHDLGTMISFDSNDMFVLQNLIDWEAEVPGFAAWKGYVRWWVCVTFVGTGYVRRNLVWGTGLGRPDLESCVKVDVKRVFID